MPSPIRIAGCTLALLACVLSADALLTGMARARAEETRRFVLPQKQVWRVGDVVTKKQTEHQTFKAFRKGPDGPALPALESDTVVSFEYVKRVLAVDQGTGEVRSLVWFKSWSRKAAGVEDLSLAGRYVGVVGAPGAQAAKVLGNGATPSAAATAWVEKEFAKDGEVDGAAVYAPTKPLAVGESWTPDAVHAAKLLGDRGMEIPPESLRMTCSLVSVDATHATVRVVIAIQAGVIPRRTAAAVLKAGEVRCEGAIPLDSAVHSGAWTMHAALRGDVQKGDAVIGSVEGAVTREYRTTVGGEIPLPGAK